MRIPEQISSSPHSKSKGLLPKEMKALMTSTALMLLAACQTPTAVQPVQKPVSTAMSTSVVSTGGIYNRNTKIENSVQFGGTGAESKSTPTVIYREGQVTIRDGGSTIMQHFGKNGSGHISVAGKVLEVKDGVIVRNDFDPEFEKEKEEE